MTQSILMDQQPVTSGEQALAHFRENLSPADQEVLDGMRFAPQKDFLSNVQDIHALPIELYLIALLLEQQKILIFLLGRLNAYDQKLYTYRLGKPCPAGD